MLSPEEKASIAQLIKSNIEEIEAKVKIYKELTKPIPPENAIGRVSRMDAINNKSVNEAALRTAENKLAKLKISLSNIDKPQFGICASCGNAIQLGRVMLLPESNKCIRCAQ